MLGLSALLHSAEPAFRTDGGNEKHPWFQLQPGKFPPEGSAHYIAGELIALDHVNRTGVLRQDRTNSVRRGDWDYPLPFRVLPFGSILFHGAPAELRDIPLGTHLHGQFYSDPRAGPESKGVFNQAFRLEDDFSFHVRQQRTWRVDKVSLDAGTLTVTGVAGTQIDAKATTFEINAATRVWHGRAIGTLSDVAVGQSLLINLTRCTLKGPGRCTDIWLDGESRSIATAHQLELHRQFQREHGLPGWIDEVDNKQGVVTVTLFAGFDPDLKKELALSDGLVTAVADDTLRTYDQGSDRMRGDVLEVQTVPAVPGNSGMRIKFKPVTLLEGFRPKRIVRLFSVKWRVDDLPREERLYDALPPASFEPPAAFGRR
jgi:hypothetical protein